MAADEPSSWDVTSPMRPLSLLRALSASKSGGLLLDSPKLSSYTKSFLTAYKPTHVIPIGSFTESVTVLDDRLEIKAAPLLTWKLGPPLEAVGAACFHRRSRWLSGRLAARPAAAVRLSAGLLGFRCTC